MRKLCFWDSSKTSSFLFAVVLQTGVCFSHACLENKSGSYPDYNINPLRFLVPLQIRYLGKWAAAQSVGTTDANSLRLLTKCDVYVNHFKLFIWEDSCKLKVNKNCFKLVSDVVNGTNHSQIADFWRLNLQQCFCDHLRKNKWSTEVCWAWSQSHQCHEVTRYCNPITVCK